MSEMLMHARVSCVAPCLVLWLSALSACQDAGSSSSDLAAASLVAPKPSPAPGKTRLMPRQGQDDFETLSGEHLRVDWVVLTAFRSEFGSGPGFSWVNLPMRSRSFKLMLILPDVGQFEAIRSQISSDSVEKLQRNAQEGTVAAKMPKFRLSDQVPGLTAATAAAQDEPQGGSPGIDLHFTADRPFLFAVFDKRTDLLLLKGQVLKPGS